MRELLTKLSEGTALSRIEMKDVTTQILAGKLTDSEIALVLASLKVRGETVEEITGIVDALREEALPIRKNLQGVIDNCGTGGDRSNSFNISTTTAFVLAGAGLKVAKHGNRSISSKTGSADVLEFLGVALDFSTEEIEYLLETNGIAFLFAPYVHAKLKPIMKVRRELGIPTIFNVIGPLTNPVELETQFLGVYREDLLMKLAAVLHQLGRRRAIVINGAFGMDEASLAGENNLVLLERGELIPFTIRPEDVGLKRYPHEAIVGGNAKENAQILLDVLKGKEGAYLDTVLLNAAIGLFAAGLVPSIKDGVDVAKQVIQSGKALEKLNVLTNYSKNRQRKVMTS